MESIPPKPPCAFGEGGEPPGPKANALLLSYSLKNHYNHVKKRKTTRIQNIQSHSRN